MTTMPYDVVGRHVAVVGGGRSGLAASRLVIQRGGHVTLIDAKTELAERAELEALGVSLTLGPMPADVPMDAELVVVSPGVPADAAPLQAARARGIRVIGELELASRWVRGSVIAITGTKGKSTTTTLVGRMLEAAGRRVLVGGNIGVPLSAQVDASTDDTVHVVETSSFQLETTDQFHPRVAALLNFSPDHLDRHPDVASYAAAKARIFANQTPDDWAVVNAESSEAVAIARAGRARQVRYAMNRGAGADVFADRGFIWQKTSDGDVPLVPLSAVRLSGTHLLSNVVAASAISSLAGADAGAMERALDGFTGLEHVMEPVATIGGVRFVNDSKATNVDAAARSIESFSSVVAIVGGKYKGGDLRDLAGPLTAHGRAVVAIGEARPLIKEALSGALPVVEAGSLADAVGRAWELAKPDGVVLLAPACASFDMFVDYADRGRRFKEEVRRLAGTDGKAGEQ